MPNLIKEGFRILGILFGLACLGYIGYIIIREFWIQHWPIILAVIAVIVVAAIGAIAFVIWKTKGHKRLR